MATDTAHDHLTRARHSLFDAAHCERLMVVVEGDLRAEAVQ